MKGKNAMPEQSEPTYFTVETANRTLPLVRKVVEDLLQEHERLESILPRLRNTSSGEEADSVEEAEQKYLREEAARISADIEGYMSELESIGCMFKGFDGLVDFHALRDGRPIFLCWRYPEEQITYWHEIDIGFAGRQRLEEPAAAASGLETSGEHDL
jgi:hypothetical protein